MLGEIYLYKVCHKFQNTTATTTTTTTTTNNNNNTAHVICKAKVMQLLVQQEAYFDISKAFR
jgi:hypothetical protein